MNLSELITALEANESVISVVLQEDHTSYVFYTLTYIEDVEQHVGNQTAICILVEDRGGPEEAAYYKGGLPPPLRYEATFRSQVIAKIEAYQAGHPELEYYVIQRADSEAQIALITAYEYDSGADTTSRNEYIIIAGTPWQFRRVV